jgi:hypothetical protein
MYKAGLAPNKEERANGRPTPSISRQKNIFLPFVYTAMDAACLNQVQMIHSFQREQQERSVRETSTVVLKKLNNLPVEP